MSDLIQWIPGEGYEPTPEEAAYMAEHHPTALMIVAAPGDLTDAELCSLDDGSGDIYRWADSGPGDAA